MFFGSLASVTKSPSWAEVIWKRGIPCKQSWRTAVWCFACTNDWRYKDEYRERTGKELHFHQFPADKKRRKECCCCCRRRRRFCLLL